MCTTGVSQTSKGNKARMARLSVFPVSQVIPHKCANWQEIRVRRLSTPTGQLQSSDKRPAPGGRETLKDLVCLKAVWCSVCWLCCASSSLLHSAAGSEETRGLVDKKQKAQGTEFQTGHWSTENVTWPRPHS